MGGYSQLPYLGMKLGHWPKFHKLHIYPHSTPGGQNWAYFHSMGSGFQDTGWISKLPYLAMKLAHWQNIQKLHTYSISTTTGRNWVYFRYTQWFPRYRPIFKTDLGMKSGHWPKFQNLHIYSLSTQGRNWADFRSTGSGFRDMDWFLNLPYLGMKLGQWPKSHMLHIYLFSPPMGSKLSLFSLYGQRFSRYGLIFKIAIFGHETWPLATVPEVAHIFPKLPQKSKFYFVLLYGWPFPRYWQFCIFPLGTMLNSIFL